MNNKSISMQSVLSSLVLSTAALAAPASWAHDDCTPYTAEFRLEGPSPFGPLNGGGIYTIGDLPPQPAQVAAVLKGSAAFDPTAPVIETTFASMALFPPDANGTLSILTGVDRVVGSATGPGSFESVTRSRITGGTGMFEDTTGRARSTSVTTVDPATGHTVADISVQGKICGM